MTTPQRLRYTDALDILGDRVSDETRHALRLWRRAEQDYERLRQGDRSEELELARAKARVARNFAGSSIHWDLELARIFRTFDDHVVDEYDVQMDDLTLVEGDRLYLEKHAPPRGKIARLIDTLRQRH